MSERGVSRGRVRALVLAALTAFALAVCAPADALSPNDPGWEFQWAQKLMRLPAVWDYTTGDPSVVIAVVDTGVNPNIPDIRDALVPGWDFTDGDAILEDTFGHGTLVTSELVAQGNNGLAIAGYCWSCKVMPIRVARTGVADETLIAAGIRWAVDHGARIINVGFQIEARGSGPNAVLGDAVRYAVEQGRIVVAGGNTGDDRLVYPAAFPGVLGVAGTDQRDALYPWSARGSWLNLAAPGCHMVIPPSNVYGELCGTSFTAPAVSGIAALALSLRPSLTAAEIAGALRSTAVPVAGIAGGRVDAFAALSFLGLLSGPPPPPPPPVSRAKTQAPGTRVTAPVGSRTPAIHFSRQAHVLFGTVRHLRSIPIVVGGGRLDLRLAAREAEECVMSVASRGRVLIGTLRGLDELTMKVFLPRGHYTVEVSCSSQRRKDYALALTGLLPDEIRRR